MVGAGQHSRGQKRLQGVVRQKAYSLNLVKLHGDALLPGGWRRVARARRNQSLGKDIEELGLLASHRRVHRQTVQIGLVDLDQPAVDADQ